MYAVGLINLGRNGYVIPSGNHGLQKLHNKTEKGWRSETSLMRKETDEIYIINDFTQEMCEMNPRKLVDHVMYKVGRRLL